MEDLGEHAQARQDLRCTHAQCRSIDEGSGQK